MSLEEQIQKLECAYEIRQNLDEVGTVVTVLVVKKWSDRSILWSHKLGTIYAIGRNYNPKDYKVGHFLNVKIGQYLSFPHVMNL